MCFFRKKDKKAKEEPKKVEKDLEANKVEQKAPAKVEKTAAKKQEPKKEPAKEKKVAKPEPKKVEKAESKKQEKVSAKGVFEYYKTQKGYYNFRLLASNKETIAVSGGTGYASLSGLKAGVESIRKNIGIQIEDQTVKNVVELSNPKYEIYQDKAGKFRYRMRARNGELICVCEDGYSTKDSCKKGIASLEKWAKTAEVVAESK